MPKRIVRFALISLSIAVLILGISLIPVYNLIASNPSTPPTPVISHRGMVVTTQHLASEVGANILKQGGNAVDAAVAIGYALAVTDPCCGNLGGGGFMLIHQQEGKNTFLNFREKAPLQATSNMYFDRQGHFQPKLSQQGYLAVAVPGTVLGLNHALANYGTMSLENIIKPAIQLAEDGFILEAGDVEILNIGREIQISSNNSPPYRQNSIFFKADNKPYNVGDRLTQKDLSRTLKIISNGGSDIFYKGEIAQNIVNSSKRKGGILTQEDFTSYTIKEQEPLYCTYREYQIITTPAPGGGIPLCEMLNILEKYDLKELGLRSANSLHYMFSSMLYSYADRNHYLGDPDFIEIPVERLISKEYAAQIRAKIPDYFAINPETVNLIQSSEGNHTTHYSVVDKQGNVVAVTYTINSYFGAGVIAEKTGFLLNNEMNDFTTALGKPNLYGLVQGNNNKIEPGKRPLSSMTPTIILKDGQVIGVTGSPGGSTIITTILQVITNLIDYNLTPEQSVNSPRFHYQGKPEFVLMEQEVISPEVQQDLEKRGYKINYKNRKWGAAESIFINSKTGELEGVNDQRKPTGKAVGVD